MLEQKRTLNDPEKLETDANRALDLAFDHKNLNNLLKDDSHTNNILPTGAAIKRDKNHLKINSEVQISLDEKNQYSDDEPENQPGQMEQ